MTERTRWFAPDLGIEDEPLIVSLFKYRQTDNRYQVDEGGLRLPHDQPNLVSSITDDGKQMPILDLDFAHHIVDSTTSGHTHLYIDVPKNRVWFLYVIWRWVFGR